MVQLGSWMIPAEAFPGTFVTLRGACGKQQQLENFAKIANKFLGQNFLDTILGHRQNFTDTAWIVGQLGQAKRIFHEYFLDIEFF